MDSALSESLRRVSFLQQTGERTGGLADTGPPGRQAEPPTCSALQLVLLQEQPLLGHRELLVRPLSHALCLGHALPIQLQLLLEVLEGSRKDAGGSSV